MFVHHVDSAPVRDILDYKVSYGRQRLLGVKRSRQHRANFKQKLLFFLKTPSLGDVSQRHCEQCLLTNPQL